MLLEYLERAFGRNKPIMFEDIKYKDYSEIWLYKELNKLCKSKKLMKYKKGIYYLPVDSIFGGIKNLDPYDVIERKYIKNNEKVYGFYSGWGLLNKVGVSAQMSSVATICTNNEASRKREVEFDNRKFIIRKSYLEITNDNVSTIQFLDAVTEMPEWFLYDKEKTGKILDYFNNMGIKKESVSVCAKCFPEKTSKRLVESGMIYGIK